MEVDTPSTPDVDIEKDLTTKFLSGALSFVEFSNEWNNRNEDDDDDEEAEQINTLERKRRDEDTQSSVQEKKHRRSKFTRLTPALLGLMGEANLRFVRGDKDTAELMCNEVIKQVPCAPEPYQTLAQIYESDPEKSLQFALVAAHLGPPDCFEWLRLAAVSKEMNNPRQEMICCTQAIRANPRDLSLHMKRIEVLERLESNGHPLYTLNVTKVKCYHKIVSNLPASEGQAILKYARLAVALYQSNNEMEHALQVMETAYNKCASLFTAQDSNFFLELLIAQKQFTQCLDVFVATIGVEIEAEIQTVENADGSVEEQTNYINCTVPENLPVDLRSKLIICFINLSAMNLVQSLLNEFMSLSNDIEKAGDLYMDIEEALSALGHNELAMQLLQPLITNPSFDLGAVWLKHAECLQKLGRQDEAIESYKRVLRLVPHHAEARLKLFKILENKGDLDDALNCLQQDYKYVVSASLLHEQCCVLKKHNKLLKYLEVGEALLSKTFMKFKHEEELKLAFRVRGVSDAIYEFRNYRGENPYHEDVIHFDEEEKFKLKPEKEWELFKELLGIALNYKKFHIMQRLSFGAITSRSLSTYRGDIEFYCLQSCLLNQDYNTAFKLVKEYCFKLSNTRTWNLFSYISNKVEFSVHGKFLYRYFDKRDNKILKDRPLILGNNFVSSGRYLVALKYFLEYHNQYKEPSTALLIAVTILAMAAQKTVDKHHSLVLQAMGYLLNYKNLRKCSQEVNYNIGRAYQMLSINNLAIEYYERALKCPTNIHCENHGAIDLTKETAFNLYILYKEQSPLMARKYLQEYLIIE